MPGDPSVRSTSTQLHWLCRKRDYRQRRQDNGKPVDMYFKIAWSCTTRLHFPGHSQTARAGPPYRTIASLPANKEEERHTPTDTDHRS